MKTRERVTAALAGATIITGVGVVLAPAAMAASGCQGVKVTNTGGQVRLELVGDCQPVKLNVSTYDLPKTYDESGHFDKTAVPQTLRRNDTLWLSKRNADKTVTLGVPSCGWYQWDVYTGPVQQHVYRAGSNNLIAGKIVHAVSPGCGRPTTSTTSTGSTTTSPTSTTSTTTSPTSSTTTSTTTSPTSTTSTTSTTTSSTTTTGSPSTSSTSTTTSPGAAATITTVGTGGGGALTPTSELAYTGADTTTPALLGFGLIAAGAGAVACTRRMRVERQH